MFDDVQLCRNATPEDESKDFADVDHDSEATPSSKPKGKAKTRHQGKGVLPSSSCLAPPDVNFPNFDVILPDIIKVSNINDGAQSLLHILEFRLDGDLGEGQVVYLREEDEDTEVSEHSSHIDEAVDVNEAAGPFSSMPLLGKKM
ncbi:hypothetical protein ACFX1Z_019204 [Malus domestica]